MSELFRKNVVAKVATPFGQTVHWSPPKLRGLLSAVLLFAVALTALVLNLDYTWKVPVQGTTQSIHPPITIKASKSGVVADLTVEVGAPVFEGQKLGAIGSLSYDKNGVSQQTHLVDALRAELANTRAGQLKLQRVQQQERLALKSQLDGVQQQINFAQAKRGVLKQLVASANDAYAKRKRLTLDRLVAEDELITTKRHWLEMRRSLLEQEATRAGLMQEQSRLQHVLGLNEAKTAYQESNHQGQVAKLMRDLEVLEGSHREIFVSPRNGVVGDIESVVGTHVTVGAGLITINPNSHQNYVELWLSSRARGQVSVGQQVFLRIAGYPQQEFGLARGEIDSISSVSRVVGGGVSRFRTRAAVLEMPKNVSFLPAGMHVEGDIELETMPVWRWLIKPLIDFLYRT